MNRPKSLADMRPGESAVVRRLCCRGGMRRRLLDLGLAENTAVSCVAESPFGSPKAFLIRGAVIALRREDCAEVLIKN